jgi:proline dehydrogenase
MQRLMRDGHYPGLATHDPAIIEEAKRFAAAEGIGRDRFEFQMLYGVRRDLQEQLVAEGYRMRVYVPFGTSWYPYLMRRLAERPANLMFMTGSVVKEALGGRRANGAGRPEAPGPEAFGRRTAPPTRSNGAARPDAEAGADVAGSGADRR